MKITRQDVTIELTPEEVKALGETFFRILESNISYLSYNPISTSAFNLPVHKDRIDLNFILEQVSNNVARDITKNSAALNKAFENRYGPNAVTGNKR